MSKKVPLPGDLTYSSLYDLLRPEERDSYALGYNTDVPPPLYQALEPGVPDLSRPVIHTDRATSNKLLAAVRRTFPVKPFDGNAESENVRPPFKTAFSKPVNTGATLGTGPPPVPVDSAGGEPDVLPYVAFGPYPSTVDGRLRAPSKSPQPKKNKNRTILTKAKTPEPMYKVMAKRWEKLEEEVFAKEHNIREEKKRDQEQRLKNRQLRMATEKSEQTARKAVKALEHQGMVELAALAAEAERIINEIEKHRETLRVQTLREAAEQRRHDRAVAAQAERARLVRERAEQIVEVEHVKMEREEQVARAKLRAFETDALHKARRREAMRVQMELDAQEDARNQAALRALEQKLEKEQPVLTGGKLYSEPTRDPEPGNNTAGSGEDSRQDRLNNTEKTTTPKEDSAQLATPAPSPMKPPPPKEDPNNTSGNNRQRVSIQEGPAGTPSAASNEPSPVACKVRLMPPEPAQRRQSSDSLSRHIGAGRKDSTASGGPLSASDEGSSTPTGSVLDFSSSHLQSHKGSFNSQSHIFQSHSAQLEFKRTLLMETDSQQSLFPRCSMSIKKKAERSSSVSSALPSSVSEGTTALAFVHSSATTAKELRGLDVLAEVQLKDAKSAPNTAAGACSYLGALQQGEGGVASFATPFIDLLARFSLPLENQSKVPREGQLVTGAKVCFKEGWRPLDKLRLATGGGEFILATSDLKLMEDPPALSLPLPPCCSIQEVLALLPQVSLECQLMDVGSRLLEVRLTIAELGTVKRSLQVRVVAPLMRHEGGSLELKDVSHVTPFESVRVNRNPYAGLESCVVTIWSESQALDEWFVDSPRFRGQLAPLGDGPTAQVGGDIIEISANSTEAKVAKIRVDPSDHRKLRIFFQSDSTPTLVEGVVHALKKRVSGAIEDVFSIQLRTKGPKELKTACSTKVVTTLSGPPLLPPFQVLTRAYRPGSVELMSVIASSDIGTIQEGLEAGTRLELALSRHDQLKDRLFLHTSKGSLFVVQGDYLYSTVRRVRVGLFQCDQHSFSVELMTSLESEEVQQILAKCSFSSEPGTALGQRHIRLTLTPPTPNDKEEEERELGVSVPEPVIRSLRTVVGPPLLQRTAKSYPTHVLVKGSHHLDLSGTSEHTGTSWLDLHPELFTAPDSLLPVSGFRIKLDILTPNQHCCAVSLHAPFTVVGDQLFTESSGVKTLVGTATMGPQTQTQLTGAGTTMCLLELERGRSQSNDDFLQGLQRCLQSLRFSLQGPELVLFRVSIVDTTNSCVAQATREVLGYLTTPSPTVLVENKELSYRQGSRPAQRGFELFPGARCLLPENRTYPTCDILVELVGGGTGDGEDVVEWLSTQKQIERYDRLSRFTTSGEPDPTRNDEADKLDSQVRAEEGLVFIGADQVGTYDLVPSGMKISLSVTSASPTQRAQGTTQPSLSQENISAVLKALTYRNSDPKIKSGARLFSAKVQWGKEESIRLRVAVNATPTLFAVPTFGAKVVAASHSLLPSICPKMVVNVDDTSVIEPALISVEIKEGVAWGASEDKVLVNAASGAQEFEVSSSGGTLSLLHQGALLGTVVLTEGSLSILAAKGVKISGKILSSLLRCVAYENLGHTTNTEPRVVEYCVEERNGDECVATVTIVIHAKEQPADIDLAVTKLDYVMLGQATVIAPHATIKCSVLDQTPVLRVEFMQQHLPADTFALETNDGEGITVQASSSSVFYAGHEQPEEPVGTFSKRGNHLTVHFSNAGLEAVTAVMRCIAFKHSGNRDRQGQKKIQFSFSPKGQLWTRIAVPVQMHERCFDLTRVTGPQLQLLPMGDSSRANLCSELKLQSGLGYGGCTLKVVFGTCGGDNEVKKTGGGQHEAVPAYEASFADFTFAVDAAAKKLELPSGVQDIQAVPPQGKAIPPSISVTMAAAATKENTEAILNTLQLVIQHPSAGGEMVEGCIRSLSNVARVPLVMSLQLPNGAITEGAIHLYILPERKT